MMRVTALAMVFAAGCAARSAPPSTEPLSATSASSDVASSGWTSSGREREGALYDDFGRPLVGSSVTFDTPAAEDRFATQTIGAAEPPPPPRPRRVGKRDIQLHGARLDNALRMLAREGRFNLVVQGDLADSVTLELRGVEPYDAALALAEANRLSLRYENGIVIAGRDKP